MKFETYAIKGCIFYILVSITLPFLPVIPAYAVAAVTVEPVPVAEAPVQEEPLPEEGLTSPDAQTEASAAMSSTPSTGGPFNETGAAYTAPSANTFSGAAGLSIPIAVLPGRLGVAPNISLNYSSLGGNGFLGVGWGLDMGSIQCRTKNGLTYPCNEFIFTKSGSTSDLVLITGNEYRAKIEDGSFIKFYKNGSGSNTYWTAYDKNGMVYSYGATAASHLDDTTGTKIFRWALDKVTDSNGNYMTLSYYKDSTNRELYLDLIDYTGNSSTNPTLSPTNQIRFIREGSIRPDPINSYLSRFAVTTNYRLSRIEVYAKISGTYTLSRKYELAYSVSPTTNRSLLNTVVLKGSDGSALPETIFSYQQKTNSLQPEVVGPATHGNYDNLSGGFKMGDVNGDGKADFVYSYNADLWVLLSQGETFAPKTVWGHRYFSLGGNTGLFVADFNGDGKADVMYESNKVIRVFLSMGNGFRPEVVWGNRIKDYYDNLIIHNEVKGYRVGDVNGDGLPDLVYNGSDAKARVLLNTGSGFATDVSWGSLAVQDFQLVDMNGDGKADIVYDTAVKLSTGTSFQSATSWGTLTEGVVGPDFNAPTFRYADMNGDGLPDLVYNGCTVDPETQICPSVTNWHVLLNTGTSYAADTIWGYRDTDITGNSGGFQLIDMNGDGLADLVYDESGSNMIRVFLSSGSALLQEENTRWGQRGASYCDKSPGMRWADMNGDGLPDLVYDSGYIRTRKNYNPYPDLISTVDNGSGSSFTLAYEPSSSYANAMLPFVLQTVSSITANDGLGTDTVTNYTYEKGYYDFADREFRGFGYARQINPDNSTYETWTHQRDTGTWYWAGAVWVNWPNCFGTITDDDDYKGKPCHTELREPWLNEAAPGVLLSKTDMLWSRDTTPQGTYPVFVRPTGKDVTVYIGGTTLLNTETYVYNAADGTLTSMTTSGPDAEAITTDNTYQYFGSGGTYPLRPTITTVTGSTTGKIRETTYGYQPNTGNMLYKEFWLSGDTSPRINMEYYSDGNLWKEYDAVGNPPTVYDYDDATKTFPRTVANPLGHTRSFTYNYLYGKVDCATDENLNDTCTDYDPFGRPKESTSFAGSETSGTLMAKTRTEYGDFEQVNNGLPVYTKKRVLETKNIITGGETYIDATVFVDGFGRPIQSISAGENNTPIVSNTYYDNMGRVEFKEGPFFGAGFGYNATAPQNVPLTQTTYNYFGKPVSIESSDGDYGAVTSTIVYNGLSTTVTDPDLKQKTEKKDYLGRIIQVVEYADAGTQTTNYVYNAAGDLLAVTDSLGNVTGMSYDTLGRKITMTDPVMGYWVYTYDQNGNLDTQTDAKNQTITFSYDALNRVLTKTYDPPSSDNPTVNYAYDNLSITNGKGRPYSVSNTKATTITNGYDALGRATSTTKTIQGDPAQYTTSTTYDYPGRPVTTTYPDGTPITNTYYPGTGLLNSVTGPGVVYAAMSNYTPSGKIGTLLQNNSVTTTTYTYDPLSTKLTDIVSKLSAAGNDPSTHIINREYFYSAAGNINTITDYKKGRELSLPNDAFVYTYTYDKLHRFTNEATTNGVYSAMAYTYNEIGNILSKSAGGTTFNYAYDPVKKHAVTSIQINGGNTYNFGYDANGNMTSGYDLTDLQNISARTITYNADNMPAQVTHARFGTTNISYDGTSNRVKKVSPSGTTYYIGAHYEVINNEPVKYIFAGNLRVAKIGATGTYFFHKDHLGSSAAMTTEAGTVVETSNYMPFGEMREHTGLDLSNYKFTDQEFDPETGLYYYGARYYDATIGRFISPDSVVQDPYDPQTLNRYTYCRNNPIIYTDPDGHIFGLGILESIIIGAVIGGATSAATGGNIGIGMLTGAISGAIFFGAGEVLQSAGKIAEVASAGKAVIHATAGALSGGINSAITGTDTGLGIITGAISAGIGSYAGGFLPKDIGSQLIGRSLIGGVTGGIASEIYGGDFGQGFAMGSATAAIGYIANEVLHPLVLKGLASYYNTGKITANGEAFDKNGMTAAMHKIKFGTTVTVAYDYVDENGQKATRSLQVRVNDRGPWAVDEKGKLITPIKPHPTRIIDLAEGAFKALTGSTRLGEVPVRITVPQN